MCMFCRSLFVLLYLFFLVIMLSVLLRFTDSDYSFSIFKLLLFQRYTMVTRVQYSPKFPMIQQVNILLFKITIIVYGPLFTIIRFGPLFTFIVQFPLGPSPRIWSIIHYYTVVSIKLDINLVISSFLKTSSILFGVLYYFNIEDIIYSIRIPLLF